MEWTAGKGTTALGIIGTTLGGLAVAGAPLLGGMMGRGAAAAAEAGCSDNHLVNRYEAGLQARVAELETDKKLLQANTYTDGKSLEMYQYLDNRLRGIESEIADQAVTNQRTADSFALAKADLAAVDARLTGEIAMERERRCCADNAIVTYTNATFYPIQVADVTTGTTTTRQTTYNPIPKCSCCNGNG